MRITALVDHEVVSRRNPGELWAGKRADVTMERDVVSTLRSSGHRVTILPLGDDLVDALDLTAPDVVFNMTEHMAATARAPAT